MKRKEQYIRERKCQKGVAYDVEFRFYDAFGEEQRYHKTFQSWKYPSAAYALKAAIADRNEARVMMDTVGLVRRNAMTVKEAYELVFKIDSMSIETERQYRIVAKYALEKLWHMDVTKVTTVHLKMCLKEIAKERSDWQLQKCLHLYRKVFNAAIEAGIPLADPTRPIKKLPEGKVPVKRRELSMSTTLPEVIEAIEAYGSKTAEGGFNRLVMTTALRLAHALGLRPAEVFALRKKDIDFQKKIIHVGYRVGSREDVNTGEIVKPKTEESVRTLPLPDYIIPFLNPLYGLQESDFLFGRYDGTLWPVRLRCAYIKRACDKKGIKFTTYQLRHNFSTELVTSNVDPRTVMELMGHKHPTMTISYARSNKELKEEALEHLQLTDNLTDKIIRDKEK